MAIVNGEYRTVLVTEQSKVPSPGVVEFDPDRFPWRLGLNQDLISSVLEQVVMGNVRCWDTTVLDQIDDV